ncbi:MAG: HEPN domain-containing protein [Armatimonadetes bacterium]|nr:HEPN domain-containing protein [Armatimonadota bacterium]
MDDTVIAAIRQWIRESQQDIESADRLLEWDPPRFPTAAYHLGQAVNKALRAFLACRGIPFGHGDRLPALLRLATPLAPTFREWREAARVIDGYRQLPPFAVQVPDEERAAAAQAVRHAQALYALLAEMLRPILSDLGRACPPPKPL